LDAVLADSQNESSEELSLLETLARSGSQAEPVVLSDSEEIPLAPVVDPLEHSPLTPEARDRFRLQAKFFFLTWPQCSTPKETVLERLSKLPTFDYAVVSREDHKDATGEHLHAFLALTKQSNKIGCKWLDAFAGKHGNYQSAKNKLHVVRYVIKDGDYVSSPGFDPLAFVLASERHKSTAGAHASKSKSEEIARLIRDEGKELDELDDLHPGHVYMNKRKIQEYLSYQKVKKAKLALAAWPGIALDSYPDADFNFKIASWLAENVKQPRAFKQKQLFLWSEGPDAGKTNLCMELAKYLATYHPPRGKFVDGYESGRFDLVVFDEFRADWTLQFLNEFVQGSHVHLDQKGSGHLKTDNPPMIFLSNSSLEEIFHKRVGTGQFEAFKSRLTVIKVPNGKKIDVFHTLV